MSFGIPVRNGLGLGLLASTSLATGNVGGPVLNLPFALTGTLDPRVTFSRPSLATMYDSTGRLVYAPNNLLTFSEDFSNASWSVGGSGGAAVGVKTPNYGVAPDGTTTACRVQLDVSAGSVGAQSQMFKGFSLSGNTIMSAWARTTDGSTKTIMGWAVNTSVPATITVTGSWTRLSATNTPTGAFNFQVILVKGTTSDTADLLVWHPQAEAVTYQTTPSTYNATTSAAYYGPRFDYNPATLVARGLLIEEARTNLLLYSEQFDNAAWGKTFSGGVTVTPNFTVSPDGTSNADLVVPNATLGLHNIRQGAATTAAVHTHTVYAKAVGYTKIGLREDYVAGNYATFNLTLGSIISQTGGIGASITSIGGGWYRLSMTPATASINMGLGIYIMDDGYTSGTPDSYPYTGNGTSGISLYGADIELGSFATSYIPTVASAVARSADSVTMTGTNFSSWYNQTQGAFVVVAASVRPLASAGGILAHLLDTGNTINMDTNGNRVCYVVSGGVNVVDLSPGGVTPDVFAKFGQAYKVNDYAAVINAGTVLTDTSGALPNTPIQLFIGNNANSQIMNGWIASLAYYNTRLPNATLQSLTT